jgi:hypothetical protein
VTAVKHMCAMYMHRAGSVAVEMNLPLAQPRVDESHKQAPQPLDRLLDKVCRAVVTAIMRVC